MSDSQQGVPRPVDGAIFPVAVLMEMRHKRQGPWAFAQWDAIGVVAGDGIAPCATAPSLVYADQDREQHLWTGFTVTLYRDSAESYWYNLVGKAPSLFVVCHEDGVGRMAPYLVTANYDEASACMEADQTVYSVPLPPEVYQWLEQYVIDNYRPQAPKKRRRNNWTEDPHEPQAPRRADPPEHRAN